MAVVVDLNRAGDAGFRPLVEELLIRHDFAALTAPPASRSAPCIERHM